MKSKTPDQLLVLVSYEIGQVSIAFCDQIYLVKTYFYLLGHPVYKAICPFIQQNIPRKDMLNQMWKRRRHLGT